MLHEEEFIKAFVIADKKERYLGFIRNPKSRCKFIAQLDHFNDLAINYVSSIPNNRQTLTEIKKLLIQKGAVASCYVISSNHRIDGQRLDLKEALTETIGSSFGTLLSCIPGRLVYVEQEGFNKRYILYKID